jgi:hypothetical protein
LSDDLYDDALFRAIIESLMNAAEPGFFEEVGQEQQFVYEDGAFQYEAAIIHKLFAEGKLPQYLHKKIMHQENHMLLENLLKGGSK